MTRATPIPRVLILAALLVFTTSGARAYEGCRAADVTGDGQVDGLDHTELLSAYGGPDGRKDLDGDGTVSDEDAAILLSYLGTSCKKTCPADLDGDEDVDAADRAAVESNLGLDCRPDLDRDGGVDGDGEDDDDDTDVLLAYFGRPAPPFSAEARADFDRDQIVSTPDLDALLAAIPRDCRADLNRDGAVDVTDIWALLASWGKCPYP